MGVGVAMGVGVGSGIGSPLHYNSKAAAKHAAWSVAIRRNASALLTFRFPCSILRRKQTALGGLRAVNPTRFAAAPRKEKEVLAPSR